MTYGQSKRDVSRARRIHAKRRAEERYGTVLTTSDLTAIRSCIQNGQSQFLGQISNSRSVHVVEYEGTHYQVVYHNKSKSILTFLPVRQS